MFRTKTLLIALLSLSLISLELVWTRIFSAEFFYTFSFLILSLAILGLGLGALALRLFKFLNNDKLLPYLLSVTGLMVIAGPPLVFALKLDFSLLLSGWGMVFRLIGVILLLSSSFFLGGIALSKLFKDSHQEMPKLYMADLVGAALGVLLCVLFMNLAGTPVTSFLSAVPVLLASIIISKKWIKAVPAVLIAGAVVMTFYADGLLENKREERAPVIYRHWDAMSKIKVYEFDEYGRGINIDNAANTPVEKFDGNFDKPDSLKPQFAIDVSYLVKQFDKCTFLSLGSGGGQDVLQALSLGAAEVHAVEVNPHINYLMEEGMLCSYSGKIFKDPRVKVITEDGRAYVRRFNNKFDVIYSLSSNSFAALASGAFALAENYLFTKEAFRDYWNSLTDRGYIMMEHQFYVPRLTSELMEALEELGVENVKSHFAVYNIPKMRRKILFVSKQPLTDEVLANAFGENDPRAVNFKYLLYPAADSIKNNPVNRIVNQGWMSAAGEMKTDISPCDDNRPFTAQLGMWKNFKPAELKSITPFEFAGFPLSKLIIAVIIAVVLLLIIPLNLLPFLFKGEKLKSVPWLYFFTIGMAFMIVEVILMQKYTYFIGPSVYSIVTILLTLLLFSGIGSRFAEKVENKKVFLGIIVWLLLDVFIFRYLIDALGSAELFSRMIITAVLIAPLGFLMGMPFPKGTLKVGPLVDWAFAVNGAASVLGSTVIILVAISFGFTAALLIGAGLYLTAFGLISYSRAW